MCTFSSIERFCYDGDNFELLEYDIPSETLLKYCGYGFYNGCAHAEFSIPESEFAKASFGTIDNELLAKKLSNYSELTDLSSFENKKAYLTDFPTGKRIFYDATELYKEDDFLSFQEIIEQLYTKGILSPNNISKVYEMFKKRSYDIQRDKEYEVRKLQRNLEKVLDK